MAKKIAEKKSESILIQKIDIRQIQRSSQDIVSWRAAIQSAESILNPTRKLLYDLYADILLDGHLTAVIGKRINAVLNKPLVFTDADGVEVEEINKLIDTEEFEEIVSEILNARFWGYTLLELDFTPEKLVPYLIDRRHVKPEMKLVVKNPSEITGVNYLEPPFDRYVLTSGKPKDLGLLMKVAQYVIYKRGNFGDWAQFAEIFGMPFRKGKYDGYDEVARQKLDEALSKAGGAAYVVIGEGSDVDFISNNSTGDGELYDKLRKACNEEISVCIAGSTLTTTQGDKGARSLGEVHAEVQEEIQAGDRRFVRRILNARLKPLMELHGYPVANGEFSFPEVEHIDKTKKIEIDMKVADRQPIADDYFYEMYDIPKPDDYDALKADMAAKLEAEAQLMRPQPPQPQPPANPPVKNIFKGLKDFFVKAPHSRGIENSLGELYICPACGGNHRVENLTPDEKRKIDLRVSQLIKDIFDGKIKLGSLDDELITLVVAKLREGVVNGFGADFDAIQTGTASHTMLGNLEKNVYQFASAKNYQQMKEMTGALKDGSGKLRTFSEFKAEASRISEVFNNAWLQTEFNFAINSGESAANWAQYEEGAADMPLLQYETVGDNRVRDEHAAIDRVVRRFDDPFWDTYLPPNGWGCRCTTIQLTDPDAGQTDLSKVSVPELPKLFRVNLAKEGLAFPAGHPYYDMKKGDLKKVNLKAEELRAKK